MTTENHRIEKYQYELRTDTKDEETRNVGLLYLYGGGHVLLAAIAFLPGTESLEKPVESPNGHVTVQMRAERLATIIDMLRNEKPVYFSWSPDQQVMRLTTREEPVGEQEQKRLFSFLYI